MQVGSDTSDLPPETELESDPPPNAYEVEREENILRNKNRMAEAHAASAALVAANSRRGGRKTKATKQ